jgi:hypothetical protein
MLTSHYGPSVQFVTRTDQCQHDLVFMLSLLGRHLQSGELFTNRIFQNAL